MIEQTFEHGDRIVNIVRFYAEEIKNGRAISDVFRHLKLEVEELKVEVALVNAGEKEGVDGIVGECIDVIACALDLIFVYKPETTNEEIARIMLEKCEKWAKHYSNSIDKQ